MTSAPATVPSLRFSEFKGEPEPIKLLDVCNGVITNGVFNDPEKRNGDFRLVNVLDMFGTDQVSVDSLSRLDLDQKEFERNKVIYGDIFFTRSSLVAAGIAWSNVFLGHDENVTFDGHLMKISPDLGKFSPAYLAQYFRSSPIRRQLIVRGKTGTMTTIGQSDIATVELRVPSLAEQQKVAELLTVVDERLQQLIQKKALLEGYKKGVMQQLFTQAVRFKDDHGNDFPGWEEKKLGELGSFKSGVGFSESEQGGKKGTPFYKVSDMNLAGNETSMNSANHYVSDAQITANKYKVITDESLVFAKVGAAIFLERKRVAKKFLIDNNMMAFIPSFDISFAKHLFAMVRLSKFAQVGALPSYNASDLKTIKVSIPPSPEEQSKIADFLSALDCKIESVATRIAQTQTFKNGLLQQMFV